MIETMKRETAVEAREPAPGNDDDIQHARLRFENYKRQVELNAQWDRRHPIYARLLYSPWLGKYLRVRRANYVTRVIAMGRA